MRYAICDALLSIAAIVVLICGYFEVAAFLWILSEFQAVHWKLAQMSKKQETSIKILSCGSDVVR